MLERHTVRSWIAAVGLAFGVAGSAWAQGASINLGGGQFDPSAPFEITSENLELNQAEGTASFSGNVFIRQGDLTLTSDSMRVEYAPDPDTGRDEIQTIRLVGGVTFVSPTEAAEAESAVYSLANESLVMSGNVLVTQGSTALSSDRLTYDLATGRGVMEGNVTTVVQQAGN